MSRLINYIRDKHALWYKFILYAVSTATIVIFMPGEGSFKYETDRLEGNPWHYENLTAPFDFPIYKSDQELKTEREELILNRKSYFFRSKSVFAQESYKGFISRIKGTVYADICKFLIDTVSSTGIIETSEITEGKKNDFPVYIVESNEEKEFKMGDFFTLSRADSFICDRLNNFPERERISLHDSVLNYFSVSVFYDKELSDKALKQGIANILPYRGMIKKGQTIINNGEIVTAEKIKILNSLKKELHFGSENSKNQKSLLFAGQFLTVGLCLGMVMLFLYFFRSNIFSRNSEITFIFLLIVLFNFIASRVSIASKDYVYYVPFSIAPIIIRTFFDSRTSLFAHLNTIIIASFFSADGFSFLVIELFGGIGAIFSVAALSRRSQLFTSILAVFISCIVAHFAVKLSTEASTYDFSFSEFTPYAVSSAAVLFAYPLIFLSEKLFGFISDFTLLELSGSNSVLMRELASKAPGTFQHSLQVANLAEEAIYKVGGNPLLVRAGALHHDIGKIKNPRYFIENRTGGINPHDELPYEESAKIIIQHVIDGIELAKSHKLPEQIIDFIRTHHGTTMTRYFFRHYQMEHSGEEVNEKMFRYPGPIPFSKETAVLMMADGVEAASRSLKNYDAQSIDQLVDQVINSLISENQFINADLTFSDVTVIKKIFKKRLMNIYHVRIEYPR